MRSLNPRDSVRKIPGQDVVEPLLPILRFKYFSSKLLVQNLFLVVCGTGDGRLMPGDPEENVMTQGVERVGLSHVHPDI